MERPLRSERPFYFRSMDLAETLRQEACRRLEESRTRIHACIDRLSDDAIWHRPNAHVVSVGNLVLHLTGNVQQWINSTLGGHPDARRREAEFSTPGPVDRSKLMTSLDGTVDAALRVIGRLQARDLERAWSVQGFRETGTGIVVHVVEHFSYHTGQITLHTKLLLDIDTGYYAGQDLDAHG